MDDTGWDEAADPFERIHAVVQAEMRSLGRQKTPFVLRTVYAALVASGVVTVGGALSSFLSSGWSGESMANLGRQVFGFVVMAQSVLTVLLAVLLAVGSIQGERRNKTLGLLVLSQLSSRDVVLGKFLAVVALVLVVVLAGLPVFALLGWAGGVDYAWLAVLGLYTPVLAGLGAATGLYFGLRYHSAVAAGTAALAVLSIPVLAAVGAEDVSGGVGCVGCIGPLRWILGSAAWGVFVLAQQDGTGTGCAWISLGIGTCLTFTWLLNRASVRILPEAAAASPGRGLRGVFEDLDDDFESINVGGIRFELGGDGSPRGNPVAWLTRTSSGIGLVRYSFRVMVAALLLTLTGVVVAAVGTWSTPLTAAWAVACLAVPLVVGATAFGSEKAHQTLGVLLATPLSAAAILRGKLYVFLRVLFLLSLPSLIFLSLMGEVDPRAAGNLTELTLVLLAEAFLIYFVTLFFSLVLATPLRAGVAAVAVLGGAHVLFLSVRLSFMSSGGIWEQARVWMLPSIVAVFLVGIWATAKRHTGVGLAALLATAAMLLGLISTGRWFSSLDLLPVKVRFASIEAAPIAVMILAAAVLVAAYTWRFFDRALGRSR